MEEVKQKLSQAELPESYRIDECSQIEDVKQFVDYSITLLSKDRLTNIDRPYFHRFKAFLNSIGIEIKVEDVR